MSRMLGVAPMSSDQLNQHYVNVKLIIIKNCKSTQLLYIPLLLLHSRTITLQSCSPIHAIHHWATRVVCPCMNYNTHWMCKRKLHLYLHSMHALALLPHLLMVEVTMTKMRFMQEVVMVMNHMNMKQTCHYTFTPFVLSCRLQLRRWHVVRSAEEGECLLIMV